MPIAFSEFQRVAMRTFNEYGSRTMNVAIYGMALAGEVGELLNVLKKHIGHGHEYDKAKVVEELGDVLWYVAALMHVLDIDCDEVFNVNIEKLKKRYPNGFDEGLSRARPDSSD